MEHNDYCYARYCTNCPTVYYCHNKSEVNDTQLDCPLCGAPIAPMVEEEE